jgi:phage tail-like protein
MAENSYPFSTFNFVVSLTIENAPVALKLANPLCYSEFSECDGLEMTMEPKTVREGGNNTQVIHLVGPVNYGNLTLKRGMTFNQDLWKWFQSAAGHSASTAIKRGMTATAEIIVKRKAAGNGNVSSKEEQIVYTLHDCLPIKIKGAPLNAKDGIIAIEEVQIAYSYFSIGTATASV